jgi:hypothetical protein
MTNLFRSAALTWWLPLATSFSALPAGFAPCLLPAQIDEASRLEYAIAGPKLNGR